MREIKTVEYEKGKIKDAPRAVIGLGLFDGVHIGHRALLSEVVRRARALSLTPAVFTFHVATEGLKSGAARIYGEEERLSLFAEVGIELVYVADFSSLSGLSPEEFVLSVLSGELNCAVAVSGHSFRFGRGAVGDADLLSRLMRETGGEALAIDDEMRFGEAVSSTRIRSCLAEGRTEETAELLGSPYFISGEVLRGRGKGHGWGFPTVNTAVRTDIPLKRGVYATRVAHRGKLYVGLTNLGTCPSFGERELHAETMLLDFAGDLYGQTVDIYFISFIREESAFSSPEELRERIGLDEKTARERIEKSKWQELGRK